MGRQRRGAGGGREGREGKRERGRTAATRASLRPFLGLADALDGDALGLARHDLVLCGDKDRLGLSARDEFDDGLVDGDGEVLGGRGVRGGGGGQLQEERGLVVGEELRVGCGVVW